MHKISYYSPEIRRLTTKIFQGDDLIGIEHLDVSREAFVKPDPAGKGQILVHNINLDIFYVPLNVRYGFDEYVSHCYIKENNQLYSIYYDGFNNLLRERTIKLPDPFAKLEYLQSGRKKLAFLERQNNMQVRQVHLMLDCVEKIGADKWARSG